MARRIPLTPEILRTHRHELVSILGADNSDARSRESIEAGFKDEQGRSLFDVVYEADRELVQALSSHAADWRRFPERESLIPEVEYQAYKHAVSLLIARLGFARPDCDSWSRLESLLADATNTAALDRLRHKYRPFTARYPSEDFDTGMDVLAQVPGALACLQKCADRVREMEQAVKEQGGYPEGDKKIGTTEGSSTELTKAFRWNMEGTKKDMTRFLFHRRLENGKSLDTRWLQPLENSGKLLIKSKSAKLHTFWFSDEALYREAVEQKALAERPKPR